MCLGFDPVDLYEVICLKIGRPQTSQVLDLLEPWIFEWVSKAKGRRLVAFQPHQTCCQTPSSMIFA